MTDNENYRVTIVKFGTRSTEKSAVYLNHHIYGTADEPRDMDYFFWILESATRTIIVDTGFSRHGGEVRSRTFLIDPVDAFAALGITGADAHPIIVTHAHYDHIGNLDLFPRSSIVMAEAELEFWLSPDCQRAQFIHSAEQGELDYLRQAHEAGRVQTFAEELDWAPGVLLTRVGGHTPGQLIVSVQTTEGTVILASDAIHYYEEYTDDLPFIFVNNVREMYAGFDTVRSLLDSGAQHLVTGHDPDTLRRFRPVTEGPLAGLAATIGSL